MTTLSIILPTWNGARFLRPQLDSILAQGDGDFELIAIDDGSSDDTVAILDDYARRDARVRRLPSEGNRGQVARLVELLSHARGTFVAIADQDDLWHPERNARLLAAIGDRAIALGRSQLIDGEGRDMECSLLEAFDVDAARVGPLGALFVPLVSAHATIIRRDWINPGAFYGTVPFDQALGLEGLFSSGLVYVDEAVVEHRLHGGNQLNGGAMRSDAPRRLLSRYRVKESLGFVGPARLWFAQRLDQLGRSAALAPSLRADFRYLAGKCWHIWFGAGTQARGLEHDLLERLSGYAASADDRSFFEANVRSLTRGVMSSTNLPIAFELYARDRYRLAHRQHRVS